MHQNKLRNWLTKTFGSLTNAAAHYNMSLPNLSRYLRKDEKGQKPGLDFLAKLNKDGCDINWLLSNDEGPPGIKEPAVEYKMKQLEKEVQELKGENEQLRSSISQITSVAQAAGQINKKKKRK